MPMPVSATWNFKVADRASMCMTCRRSTIWPELVNLMALLTRLFRIWRMRVTSPITTEGEATSARAYMCNPFASARAA
ncbi:hypothetical protein D3C85_1343530 [compost metagenome]